MNPVGTRKIHRLLTETPLDDAAIDAFLAENPPPIAEDAGVTFIYRGAADAVYLHHWIYGLESAKAFHRAGESDLWYRFEDIPAHSRVEYKFEVVNGDEHRLIRDPLNPALAHDPFGANSVCHGAGYETPDWIAPDPEAREGALEDHAVRSPSFGGRRRVTLYFPARFRRTRRYPLLIVHDGGDFLRYASMKTVLDNLIHRLEIPPMVVALTHPVARNDEYVINDAHATFITRELGPWLEKSYPLIPEPSSRGLMGASLGGVASFYTAWKTPGHFGRLLIQSGSLAFTDIGPNRRGPVFEPIVTFMNAYRDEPVKITNRLFQSCGIYESLIYENRSLMPLLQTTGMEIRYVEARDGHNWENWRDRLREGLSWLFPGPLWMDYE